MAVPHVNLGNPVAIHVYRGWPTCCEQCEQTAGHKWSEHISNDPGADVRFVAQRADVAAAGVQVCFGRSIHERKISDVPSADEPAESSVGRSAPRYRACRSMDVRRGVQPVS